MCQHSRKGACGLHISAINSRGILYHFRADCQCWSCPYCVETILRDRLLRHLLKISGRSLYHVACHSSEWKRFYNRIRGKRYFRISLGSVIHIFTTAPLGDRVSGTALRKLIEKVVKSAPYASCPFSSCRAWAMHNRHDNKDCVALGMSAVTSEQMEEAAKIIGVKCRRLGSLLTISVKSERTAKSLLSLARLFYRQDKANCSKVKLSSNAYDNSQDRSRRSSKAQEKSGVLNL